ncbi:MAG: hypothetical protein GY849_15620 [Deltaproteobacteria bacterium]|nr:hypothetical protein [Deltaproteobacteria bacterium]
MTKKRVLQSYGKLPLYFIENRGQVDKEVLFYAKLSNQTIYFTRDRVVFDLIRRQEAKGRKREPEKQGTADKRQQTAERLVFSLLIKGAGKGASVKGVDKQKHRANYFVGKKDNWKTSIATYRGIIYKEIYKGIDLKVYGSERALEYDFVVHPGADPKKIRLAYVGIKGLRVNEKGELIIQTPFGDLKESRPHAYQMIDGKKVKVEAEFRLEKGDSKPATRDAQAVNRQSKTMYGFKVASHNPAHPLIIDPIIYCSAFLPLMP